jgi:hypothetical protein
VGEEVDQVHSFQLMEVREEEVELISKEEEAGLAFQASRWEL